jgi:phosphatidylinositol glycan class O
MEHLVPELEKSDSDVIIGHFLGVDHVGHRYGPDHPEMALKLSQMNEVLSELIDRTGEDTVLFVMGDHGMTPDGNHGGASDLEVGY